MSAELSLRNQQRAGRVDTAYLGKIARSLLHDELKVADYDLTICLVGESAMVRLNETYLHHAGSTDVITFDYSDPVASALSGEIFICVVEAIKQAARFRSTWQSEVVRYLIHGLLHLSGYDDRKPSLRRVMKRKEERLLWQASCRFKLRLVGSRAAGKRRV